jgi:hypothetical protein
LEGRVGLEGRVRWEGQSRVGGQFKVGGSVVDPDPELFAGYTGFVLKLLIFVGKICNWQCNVYSG